MRRLASEVLRDLEIRIARLEKSSNVTLSGVALDFIKRYRKSLNRLLGKHGIEIRPTLSMAANISLKIEGVQGLIGIVDHGHGDDLHAEHKMKRKSGGSWDIDVRNFVSLNPETGRSSLWDLKDWDFDKEAFVREILLLARETKQNLLVRVASLEKSASKYDHLINTQTGEIYDHLSEKAPRNEYRKLNSIYNKMRSEDDVSLEQQLDSYLADEGLIFSDEVVIANLKSSARHVDFDIYTPVYGGGYGIHKARLSDLGWVGISIEDRPPH